MPKYVLKDPGDRIILVNADYYSVSSDGLSYDLYTKPALLVGSFSRHFYSIVDDAAELVDFHLNEPEEDESADVCNDCREAEAETESERFYNLVWDIISDWHVSEQPDPANEETIQ